MPATQPSASAHKAAPRAFVTPVVRELPRPLDPARGTGAW
jgi:hypothetical protein